MTRVLYSTSASNQGTTTGVTATIAAPSKTATPTNPGFSAGRLQALVAAPNAANATVVTVNPQNMGQFPTSGTVFYFANGNDGSGGPGPKTLASQGTFTYSGLTIATSGATLTGCSGAPALNIGDTLYTVPLLGGQVQIPSVDGSNNTYGGEAIAYAPTIVTVSSDVGALVSIQSPSGTTIWWMRFAAAFTWSEPFEQAMLGDETASPAIIGARNAAMLLIIGASTAHCEATIEADAILLG